MCRLKWNADENGLMQEIVRKNFSESGGQRLRKVIFVGSVEWGYYKKQNEKLSKPALGGCVRVR